MRRCLTAILVVGASSIAAVSANAQDAKDLVAYGAILSTPLGGLTPLVVSSGVRGEKAFNSVAGQYAHFSPQGGGSGSNVFGGTFYHKAAMNAAVSGTVGYGTCDGCDGTLMLGGDVQSALWNSDSKSSAATSINVQGTLGYGHSGDITAFSAAVGLPLAISMSQASKSRFGLFVTPAYAWGRLSGNGNSENGYLPMVSAGASWMAPAGWGLHVSYSKVIIESVSGNNIGAGFSWRM